MKPRYKNTKIITVAAQKGGSGKTTIGIHLAALGRQYARILMVDTDSQETMTKWWDRREDDELLIVKASAGKIKDIKAAAIEDHIDLIIVDTPPHTASQIAEVVRHSNLVLIPCRPTPFDLEAMGKTIDIVNRAKIPVYLILNQVPPKGSIIKEAHEYINSEYNIPICPVSIGDRSGLIYATIDGKGITEYQPKSKAANEFRKLWTFLDRKLKRL